MSKKKILFVCVHNSARSVMAEAFINNLFGDKFEAESAGLEPGTLNQNVVSIMNEINIDISQKTPQSVFELFKNGKRYNYIITVCDGANAEKCPIFPGVSKTIHWSFEDPSKYSHAEYDESDALAKIRPIRDEIKNQITEWVNGLEN
jgi:arsenate reductase